MTRFALAITVVAGAGCVWAQPPGPQMGASSTLVFGGVSDGKQFNFVSRAGGFFIDSRHVVSNLEDCCSKSEKGEQVTPIIYGGKDDAGTAKVIWSSEDSEIAILELEKPLNHPGVSILPSKLVRSGQAVYSVQYPKPGEKGPAQLVEGKLTGGGTAGDSKVQLYKSSLQQNANNSGGAMFDACGNAIGINFAMKNGDQYAVVVDPLIGALKAAGVQATISDQPCSAGGGVGAGGGGTQSGSAKDGGKQAKGKEAEDEKPASGWRMPRGEEWIPVVIVVGLVVLALRPARRQNAQAIPGPQRIPEPAPYPYPAGPTPHASAPTPYPPPPAPYGAAAPMVAPTSAATKPALKGITGQYAGSSFPLDGGTSILGRDPSAANLVFTGEASSVSKRHCSVRWDPSSGYFLVEDHGSTNGTFLSTGERLTPHQPRGLRPGERFYIGDLRNQFEVTMDS